MFTVSEVQAFARRIHADFRNHDYALRGRVRQAKTERHRALARYLEHSADRFVPAPGTRGMVMIVFTLPGHHRVFKVIPDRFAPSRKVTREQVLER